MFSLPSELVDLRRAAGTDVRSGEAAWQRLADLDFFAHPVEREHGGTGGGVLTAAVVFEGVAATGYAPMLAAFVALVARALAAVGSERAREEILPALVAAERRVSIAATEERAGFNLFAIESSIRPEGDEVVLDGSKVYVSGADEADLLFVVGRSMSADEARDRGQPKSAGLSVLLVPTDAAGIEMAEMSTRGEGEHRQFRLRFDAVRVPRWLVLGRLHEGASVLFPAFNLERVLFSAMTAGLAEFCLRSGAEHAGRRRVFGDTPVGAYQAVQHPLADARIRQRAVRLLTYRTAASMDDGEEATVVVRRANAAKYLGSELLLKAVDAAMEAMGGRGFDEEYGVVQLWETARLLKLSPLSNALILNDVASRELGLPRSY